MRAVFQFPASMTSVVDAPRAVSSDASPTRPLCAVTRASMPAARAGYGELIAWTVGELLEAFYRGGGKVRRSGERPGDWELIRRACRRISGAAIPWRVPSGNAQPMPQLIAALRARDQRLGLGDATEVQQVA